MVNTRPVVSIVFFLFASFSPGIHGFARPPILTRQNHFIRTSDGHGDEGPLPVLSVGRLSNTVKLSATKIANNEDLINDFCVGTNEFWKKLVVKPVRDYVEMQPAGTSGTDFFSKAIAPPELPGIPRPVWFVIAASVPTALGWYGYYKFSIEEELYQYELQQDGQVSGCGGYGTLFPFVYGVICGFPLSVLHITGGDFILEAAALWILLGQVNLYRRVNEIISDQGKEPPLFSWWALLPPPLDVVVGLRQVHFLSEYWREVRNEPESKDIVAQELFPFISAPRFTLRTFFRTPSMWFWFTKDWEDFDQVEILRE